jgi:hypothetical protein
MALSDIDDSILNEQYNSLPPMPENPPDLPEIKPGKPRIVVRNAAYVLQPQPPIEYIIEKIITEKSVNMYYGEPGSKKTYSLLSLAVCVALGKPWLEFTTRQTKVLIVDEESGETRLNKRLGDAIRGEIGDDSALVEYVSLAGFILNEPGDVALLEALVTERGAGLVIIDALADVMTGDENSKEDTQPIFRALRKIAEHTGAAIIIIHHSNRTGSYRGSSAIKGALDVMVKISSDDQSNFIMYQTEKTRDIEPMTWAALAYWTENQFYLTIAERQSKTRRHSASDEYVLKYLKEHGASALPDIMGAADTCSPAAARQAVYRLAIASEIYRTNPGTTGGRGNAAIYDLSKRDEDENPPDE